MVNRVTVRKYMGDDQYSWAVFLDGLPRMTGLMRSEVSFYKREVERLAGITSERKVRGGGAQIKM